MVFSIHLYILITFFLHLLLQTCRCDAVRPKSALLLFFILFSILFFLSFLLFFLLFILLFLLFSLFFLFYFILSLLVRLFWLLRLNTCMNASRMSEDKLQNSRTFRLPVGSKMVEPASSI